MSYNPFTPQGNSVLLTAKVTPDTGVQIPATSQIQPSQFRIKISSTAGGDVVIGYGTTAALAATNAVVPTGTSQQSLMFSPGQCEIFTFPPGTYFSAGIAAATASVFITCGDGP